MSKIKEILALAKAYRKETKKSFLWSMPDYLKLRRQLGIGFSEYFDYGLYSANDEIRNAFLGNREQGKYLSILNPRKYFSICRNKYFSHLFLESVLGYGAMAELYCYYNPEYNITPPLFQYTNCMQSSRCDKVIEGEIGCLMCHQDH